MNKKKKKKKRNPTLAVTERARLGQEELMLEGLKFQENSLLLFAHAIDQRFGRTLQSLWRAVLGKGAEGKFQLNLECVQLLLALLALGEMSRLRYLADEILLADGRWGSASLFLGLSLFAMDMLFLVDTIRQGKARRLGQRGDGFRLVVFHEVDDFQLAIEGGHPPPIPKIFLQQER